LTNYSNLNIGSTYSRLKNSKIEASSLSLRRIALKNLNKSDFDDNKVVSPAV